MATTAFSPGQHAAARVTLTVQYGGSEAAYTDGGGPLTRAPLNLKNLRQGRRYCGVIGRVL